MDRGCTDILCCLIFIAFMVLLAGVAGYAFTNGDVTKLTVTWDYDKNPCGFNQTKDYPYLYFPAIDAQAAGDAASAANNGTIKVSSLSAAFQYSTCVKECPTATSVVNCKVPSFMIKDPKYYKNCTWFPAGVSFPATAVRYET